ncbi:hypothetical protein [Ewingella americana]|uniref:hypothetical protein n=1 Tax=Ewingella americana TaxID=41202 RepID=UPI00138674B5|nr:hypothetical protein [Ewingella americana]
MNMKEKCQTCNRKMSKTISIGTLGGTLEVAKILIKEMAFFISSVLENRKTSVVFP